MCHFVACGFVLLWLFIFISFLIMFFVIRLLFPSVSFNVLSCVCFVFR